jgi:RNA polymerase sigma-70 factor (ECF subfamily)
MDDETIYRENREDLIRYGTVLVGSTSAEDAVSTVVLRVLARRRLVDLRDARPYLFRAVLNECRTRLDRDRNHSTLTNVDGSQSVNPQPEVLAAVLGLPVRQRAATYLVYWAGMSVAETALLMDIRPGTVKRYLHLARRVLKGVLDAG